MYKHIKKINQFFSKHVWYTSLIHAIGGVGVGILIARPYVAHPVRVGVFLIAIAVLGHLYGYLNK